MWENPIMIYQTAMNGITTEIEGQIIAEIKTQVGIDIDKEELIRAINYDRDQYNKGYQDGLNADRWIPVSERLPNKSGKYWCTFGGTNLTGTDLYTTKDDAEIDFDEPEEYIGWRSQNVIAWMPTPKPYKAESEEEDE